MLYKESN